MSKIILDIQRGVKIVLTNSIGDTFEIDTYNQRNEPLCDFLIRSMTDSKKDKDSFSANDIDGMYLLGVFNTTGMDGLAKEIARLKELKMNPSAMLQILKLVE